MSHEKLCVINVKDFSALVTSTTKTHFIFHISFVMSTSLHKRTVIVDKYINKNTYIHLPRFVINHLFNVYKVIKHAK